MYSDYSKSSLDVINEYKLDLEFFYRNEYYSNSIIEEIPCDKINLLIDSAVELLNQKQFKKSFLFDFENIKQFIDVSVDLIISNLKEEKLI